MIKKIILKWKIKRIKKKIDSIHADGKIVNSRMYEDMHYYEKELKKCR